MNTHLSADEDYNLWVLLHQVRDVIFRAERQNSVNMASQLCRLGFCLFLMPLRERQHLLRYRGGCYESPTRFLSFSPEWRGKVW